MVQTKSASQSAGYSSGGLSGIKTVSAACDQTSGTMKKDTSRNFTTCVVTLFIIGSVLFSAVESVRVSTKRVKGEYHHKMVF